MKLIKKQIFGCLILFSIISSRSLVIWDYPTSCLHNDEVFIMSSLLNLWNHSDFWPLCWCSISGKLPWKHESPWFYKLMCVNLFWCKGCSNIQVSKRMSTWVPTCSRTFCRFLFMSPMRPNVLNVSKSLSDSLRGLWGFVTCDPRPSTTKRAPPKISTGSSIIVSVVPNALVIDLILFWNKSILRWHSIGCGVIGARGTGGRGDDRHLKKEKLWKTKLKIWKGKADTRRIDQNDSVIKQKVIWNRITALEKKKHEWEDTTWQANRRERTSHVKETKN